MLIECVQVTRLWKLYRKQPGDTEDYFRRWRRNAIRSVMHENWMDASWGEVKPRDNRPHNQITGYELSRAIAARDITQVCKLANTLRDAQSRKNLIYMMGYLEIEFCDWCGDLRPRSNTAQVFDNLICKTCLESIGFSLTDFF